MPKCGVKLEVMEKTSKNIKSAFAKNVISRRADMGLSGEKFAEFVGIPYGTLRDIEAGISGGRFSTKQKIASALKTTVDILEGDSFSPSPRSETITAIVTALPSLNDADLGEVLGLIQSKTRKP